MPAGDVERAPDRAAEDVVAQLALHGGGAGGLLSVELRPEPAARDVCTLGVLEHAETVRAGDDERQVHHAAEQRYRPVVVMLVAKQLQLGDYSWHVVHDEAANVAHAEPEVAVQRLLTIVRGCMSPLRVRQVAIRDLIDLGDVKRPVVGEIQIQRFGLLAFEPRCQAADVAEVGLRLLAVGRADLAPPHVDRLALEDVVAGGGRLAEENGQVLLHGVDRVGGVPDGHQMHDGGLQGRAWSQEWACARVTDVRAEGRRSEGNCHLLGIVTATLVAGDLMVHRT